MKKWANMKVVSIFAALMIVLMSLAACDSGGAAAKSNADLLKEGAANMKALKTYHIVADIDQAGQAVKLSGDVETATKNTKLDIEASGQKVSLIKIGTDAYISTDAGKTYTKADAASMNFDSFITMWDSFKPEDIDKAKNDLKDATPATDKINGVDTKHMTADASKLSSLSATGTTAAPDTTGTMDLWVSTDAKPLVHQIKLDMTSGGQAQKGTLTWSKFDQAVEIKAPPASSMVAPALAGR